jgi:hypothetical protein
MPWHRERIFHGYLGQGHKHIIVTRPNDDGKYTAYMGGQGGSDAITEAQHPALMDDFTTLDGRRMIQSAKGIKIVKRAGPVSPVRKYRPDQPDGIADDHKNYKAAGQKGDGPDHAITGDIEADRELPHLNRAAGVLDLTAYMFNYAGLHPFFWHAEDWKVHQESELDHTEGDSIMIPSFTQLATSMYLDPTPDYTIDNVDHRYNKQTFYKSEAGIEITDDGGIVIYDGYGSEIRMVGGHIHFSAPGDVWAKAGRNIQHWAGRDLIQRAYNSVDITATEHDVRVKAERNLQILGGNDTEGSVLIESRAPAPLYDYECGERAETGGIHLKCRKAPLVSVTAGAYIRTGGGDVLLGDIVLDADRGSGNVVTHCSERNDFITSAAHHYFGRRGEITNANRFASWQTVLGSPTCIAGPATILGSTIIRGYFLAVGGHIATEMCIPDVGCLEGESLNMARDQLTQCQATAEEQLPRDGATDYDEQLQQPYYLADKPGEEETIRKIQFSLRSLEDYRVDDFKIYEDYWQKLARLSDQAPNVWEEKPVKCAGADTYPFPGQEKFEGDTYWESDLEIYEIEGQSGHSRDRGEAPELASEYEEPKYGTADKKPLQGTYTIIG